MIIHERRTDTRKITVKITKLSLFTSISPKEQFSETEKLADSINNQSDRCVIFKEKFSRKKRKIKIHYIQMQIPNDEHDHYTGQMQSNKNYFKKKRFSSILTH